MLRLLSIVALIALILASMVNPATASCSAPQLDETLFEA